MLAVLVASLIAAAPGSAPVAVADDPPIRIWLNNDRRFEPGDRARVEVRVEQDGYLVVLNADPEGRLRVLFPLDPGDDNFVRGGKRYELKGRGGRESFTVEAESGRGVVYAAVSRDPMHFEQFVAGDHWDYRVFSDTRADGDVEPELTELVRRMAGNSFDYDLLSYEVVGRYASSGGTVGYNDYGYSPYDPYSGGCFSCGYYGGRSSLNIQLGFGRPYFGRPYLYDPFYYDPFFYRPVGFYDPYYYDPYYYRPYVTYPYYGGRRYAGYRDRYPGYYGGGYTTPYRFKSGNRTWNGDAAADYRFRSTFQATNTVYAPLPTNAARGGQVSAPARRRSFDGTPDAVTTTRSGGTFDASREARPTRRVDGDPRTQGNAGAQRGAGTQGDPRTRQRETASWPQQVGPGATPSTGERSAEQPRRAAPPEIERGAPETARPSWPVNVGRPSEEPRRVERSNEERPQPAVRPQMETRPSERAVEPRRSEPRPTFERAPERAPEARSAPAPSRGAGARPSFGERGGESRGGGGGGGGGGGRRRG
jgi:hypothetical protein